MIIKSFDPKKELIFDLKVVEACKSCKRYGLTGCCPPNIGSFDYYKKLLKRYAFGRIYILKYAVDDSKNYKEIGRQSSLDLHKVLLKEREKLLNKGFIFNIMLSGGSCKYCKECSIPCKLPQYRALPIESTGINVIETLRRMGFFIKFPVKRIFYRVGALLWDEI